MQTLNFIALNPNLETINLTNLKLTILSKQNISVPVKQYNNSYRYQTVTKENVESICDFKISDKSTNYTLPTDKTGDYVLEIQDENNKLLRVEYFVAGSSNIGYEIDKDANMSLMLENTSVDQGGTVNFNITAPYEGPALVTIEKDKVYASKWLYLTTNSTQASIRLPQELKGDAYVNVAMLRARNSKEIFMSPFSFALAHFSISTKKQALTPKISVPALIKPGEELKIQYSTSQPAKMILFGVNEGILQVAGYKTPNPLNYFFRKSALEVATYQIWDMLLPEMDLLHETAGIGGDFNYQKALLEAGLNPFARKRNKPVVFWSGILDVNNTPKTYTYKVPDYFNGKIRIMSVVVNDKYMGSSENFTKVRAPIVLSASAPVAVAPQDVFDIGLKIAPTEVISKNGHFLVKITASDNLEIIGEKEKNVTILAQTEQTVFFKAKALENFGQATISFEVCPPNPQDTTKLTLSLSNRPARSYETDITAHNTTKTNLKVENYKPLSLYENFAEKSLAVSNNPLVLTYGLNYFLRGFPHGCTEQIISQSYPDIILKANTKKSKIVFSNLISKLRARQKFSGGMSLWDRDEEIDEFASLYTLEFLTEAKELGYNVPDDVLNNLLSWVERYVTDKVQDELPVMTHLYAHYFLARNGKTATSALSNLINYLNRNDVGWEKNIQGAYVASIYALLQDTDKAEELIKKSKVSVNTGKQYDTDYESADINNADYLYLVARHFPKLAKESSNMKVIQNLVQAIADKHYNTLSSGKTIRALYAYGQYLSTGDDDIEVTVNNKPLTLKKENNALVSTLPDDASDIRIKNNNKSSLGLFYVITQQGYQKTPVTRTKNGLIIDKKFYDKPGHEIDTVTIGDDVTVKITVRSTDNTDPVSNVAITDILPGGLMITDEKVNGNPESFNIQEDRVMIYTTATKDEKEFSYTAKAIASGQFTNPAVFAQSLYDNEINATGNEGKFVVHPRE